MATKSRKRAPLVHRSSNVDVSCDFTNACKRLAALDNEPIDITSINDLVLYIIDCMPAECSVSVSQLFASKLSKHTLSHSARNRLVEFLEGSVSSTNPYRFPLVRLLAKQERTKCIDWKGCDLLGLELAAWDSLSDGGGMKRTLCDKILAAGLADKYATELSLFPTIPMTDKNEATIAAHNCRSLLTACTIEDLTRSLGGLAHEGAAVQRLVGGLLLNVVVWTARLLGSDQSALNAIDLVTEAKLEHQKRLLQVQLGVRLYDPLSSDLKLTRLLTSVTLGESLGNHKSENRYEVALICTQISLMAYRDNDLVSCVVHALYSLHCLKFSEVVKKGHVIETSLGIDGLLSVLHSEKALPTVVPPIPSLAKIFVALESVRLAAFAYEQMGYLPGASWLLHKGLDYLGLMKKDELVRNRLTRFQEVFKSRLKVIHFDSETAIFDSNIDSAMFDASGGGMSLLDPTITVSSRLQMLHRIVCDQRALLQTGNLDSLRLKPKTNKTPPMPNSAFSGCWVTFEITAQDCLAVKIEEDGVEAIAFSGCSDVTATAHALISQLNALLSSNKESISSANDSKEFWNDRRLIDGQLEELFERMQFQLFGDAKNYFALPSQTVFLDLPDIFLALPIESLPLFRDYLCVRAVHIPMKPVAGSEGTVRGSYVINPSGDCNSTESTILPLLEGWKGRSGSTTLSDQELVDQLSNSDLFLYSGHGGGEKHWSGSSIQRLQKQDGGIALLMGCGSAKPYGDYCSAFCTPFHYLIGGFGIVVGTLWDVLGRELDKVSSDIISSNANICRSQFVCSFLSSFRHAKSRVKLKSLSGSSLIVYVNTDIFPLIR